MIYQLAATNARCEQSFNVPVLKWSFRDETRRAVNEPSKRLTFGNDTLRQLGRPLAVRTYLGEVRRGNCVKWPAPGSEDTELGALMELEVGHGETEVYPRVQA